ncbi:Glutamate Aspartate transport system permease protein GltJ (TC 3.A.1.3.4) [hydrothermal vent metagenome]|uniref:Glutamate Aspartate transport system permease protein GltJ (TC 3.A.1.3.4) n=1 Tax=hydrothermal vent metagenome TaxID=652676 RepID=A0A3B0T8D4_9ZZZZ
MTVQVREQTKTPLWRNATFLKWSAQLFVLLLVIGVFALLVSQALTNFAQSDISFGWTWLSSPTGVQLREGIDINPDSGARALLVGIVNTLRVAVSGIFAATILGTLIGIGRLSSNWIVNKIATIYIETIRNVPLLVQIFFWSAIAVTLPALTADDVGEFLFKASNKGIAYAWIFPGLGWLPWLTFVIVGFFIGRYVARRRKAYQEETGNLGHGGRYWIGIIVLFGAIGWFAWPLLGFMGYVFGAIESFVDALPPIVFPIIVAIAALASAAWWIRNFFESRRTPAGFGKMTDDDWFRVIFTGFAGIAIAVGAFVIGEFAIKTVAGDTETVAELIRTGLGNFFGWLSAAFSGEVTTIVDATQGVVREGGPLVFSKPAVVLKGAGIPQFADTGMVITVPFFAIWTGVTLYTAAFIAEIVRGGILAVSKGQTEAAQAVGLRRSQYLRLIILPQAFRIILPPMGNQYLNLAKNTSLGIAVAFADIVAVGFTVLNQTGQSLPVVVIWMAFFVTMSLSISSIVNYYNRKMMLVER